MFLQGEKKKYILIPELFATRYLSMALQEEKLAFISVSFPSLAATTENTVHPFSLSVGAPLYLQFGFNDYFKAQELSKSSTEQ